MPKGKSHSNQKGSFGSEKNLMIKYRLKNICTHFQNELNQNRNIWNLTFATVWIVWSVFVECLWFLFHCHEIWIWCDANNPKQKFWVSFLFLFCSVSVYAKEFTSQDSERCDATPLVYIKFVTMLCDAKTKMSCICSSNEFIARKPY